MCRCPLLVTDALVALVTDKYAVIRVVVRCHSYRVLMVPGLVVLAYPIIVPEGRGCRCNPTQARNVTTSAL